MSQHIHADATYKLIWQGFSVLIIGTTDFNKVLHPFDLARCSNEKTKHFEFIFNNIQIGMQKINKALLKSTTLISDVANSIKNVFKNVYNYSYSQIMCWMDMKRKVENSLCQVDDKNVRKKLIDDAELLQLCNAIAAFELALILFMKTWNMSVKQKSK